MIEPNYELLEKAAKYYIDDYGDETITLLRSLLNPSEKVALLNPFIETPKEIIACAKAVPGLAKSFAVSIPENIKPILKNGLLSHYFLDASSLIAPLSLPLEPANIVLDMCAAPGGKLLAMIFRQIPELNFVACDISPDRIRRLKEVLKNYVPERLNNVRVLNADAIKLCMREREKFDAILLDAPCSSEAHVLQKPDGFLNFCGPQKNLPYRQYALLCAGLIGLKSSGYLAYATCSINRAENEGVIERLRKKKSIKIIKPDSLILPHRDMAGPAYVCLMQK